MREPPKHLDRVAWLAGYDEGLANMQKTWENHEANVRKAAARELRILRESKRMLKTRPSARSTDMAIDHVTFAITNFRQFCRENL